MFAHTKKLIISLVLCCLVKKLGKNSPYQGPKNIPKWKFLLSSLLVVNDLSSFLANFVVILLHLYEIYAEFFVCELILFISCQLFFLCIMRIFSPITHTRKRIYYNNHCIQSEQDKKIPSVFTVFREEGEYQLKKMYCCRYANQTYTESNHHIRMAYIVVYVLYFLGENTRICGSVCVIVTV